MKKYLNISITLILIVVILLTGCTSNNSMKSGEYTSSFEGMGGKANLKVKIEDNKLISIDILDSYETPGIGLYAQDNIKNEIVRRQTLMVDTITGATVTSMAVLTAVEDCLKQAGANIDLWNDIKDKEVHDYPSQLSSEVVIIGGGGAGLAAAVSAIENGANVIVLEKMGFLGGNTAVCGGIYNCPDPKLQTPAGITDSVELFKKQTLEGGDNAANPELVEVLTSQSFDGLQWVKSMGAPFKNTITQGPGSLYPRTHVSEKPLGTGLIETYIEFLNKHPKSCQILTDTEATDIIIEDNYAKKVRAKNKDGSELLVSCDKAVILSTGGFAGNRELREKYNTSGKWPSLKNQESTNVMGNTGDGIKMAEKIGCDFVDMEHIQLLHMCNPDDGRISGICLGKGVAGELFLNKEGERFVKEDGRRDEICLAVMKQDGQIFYDIQSAESIENPDMIKSLEGIELNTLVENNMYNWIKADSIEDLAKKLNMNIEKVKNSIDQYNKAVDTKKDIFGRELLVSKIQTPPFYAYPRTVSVHHTMGGVKIDTKARVINKDGDIIKGLYAAGEVTGGIHGANRLGGNAVVDTVVFGRLAGKNAANLDIKK